MLARGCGLLNSGQDDRGIRSGWYPQTLARRICDIGSIRERITFMKSVKYTSALKLATADAEEMFGRLMKKVVKHPACQAVLNLEKFVKLFSCVNILVPS